MQRSRMMSTTFLGVLLTIGCGGSKPQDAAATTKSADHPNAPMQLAEATTASHPASPAGAASITGTVKFQGTVPTAEKIKMDADPACAQQHPSPMYSEEVVVNANNTLKNVFVYVKSGATGPFAAPTSPVTLTQSGCWYLPHVFGIQVNQPLEIVNNDATLHNINAKPTTNQPFNIAQPVKGMKSSKKFTAPEMAVTFKCNVHPWMHAYGHVLEHPFFSVSGEDGSFTIAGLPAGTYVVEAWHEKYGSQTQTVTVADGEKKSVEFSFKAP